MNIFTKLAMDHLVGGDSPVVLGKNELAPLHPSSAHPKLKEDVQGHMTDLTAQVHEQQTQGQLSRAFSQYLPSVEDYKKTMGDLLSANIERISGRSAASQALARHRG